MNVGHAKSQTVGDPTGIITVFNSQGSTTTVAATDLVRPVDWNSAHRQSVYVSSQTLGTSSATATNFVFGVSNALASMSTAASAATVNISVVNDTTYSDYVPISGSAVITNASLGQNSLYFVPFDVPHRMFIGRVNFLASVGTTVSAGNNTGSAAISFSAAMYSRYSDSYDRIGTFWSGSMAIQGTKNSNTQLVFTNVIGLSNSTAVSTQGTSLSTSNATTYPLRSVGGYRVWALPVSSSFNPGRYWMAVAASTTADSAVARMGIKASIGIQTRGVVAHIAYQQVGTSSSASDVSYAGILPGAGTYSATSGAFPATVGLTNSAIVNGRTHSFPYFNFSAYATSAGII